MTKSDLRTGMIITRRDGRRAVVYLKVFPIMMGNSQDVLVSESGWMSLSDFDEALTCPIEPQFDIVKIESAPTVVWFPTPFDKDLKTKVLWERTKKITISEIENILGYKVEIINDK